MPVMPTSARAAISTLNESRTVTSVLWIEMAFSCGWLIWTPMKMAPAATAARPAHRVSRFGVIVMSGTLLGLVRGRCRGGYLEGRKAQAVPASPHDVTDDV